MCGRFVRYRSVDQLKRHFRIDLASCQAEEANYNIAPGQHVLAIIRDGGTNVLDNFHWGLVPFWAKDTSIGFKMINARSETVATKPSFREAFKKRRCLILADGFYEWKAHKGQKQPVFITLPDEAPFAFAGLWETWQSRAKDGENPDPVPYRSCTIITREASDCIKGIHDRMPVILRQDAYDEWLDPDSRDVWELQQLLSQKVLTDLVFRPVSKQVNSVRNNEPTNISAIQVELL